MDQVRPGSNWDPLAPHPSPFDEYATLRERCPVVHSDAFGGYWMLSGYRDVAKAAMDHSTFASGLPFVENVATRQLEAIPISLNPPLHTKYRRLLSPFFRAARIAEFEPEVRQLARQHLEPMLARGSGDFVGNVSYALPARVLCRFLGLRDEVWRELKALGKSSDDSRTGEAEAAHHNQRLFSFIKDIIDERRAALRDPETDLLTAVLLATVECEPIPEDTVVLIVKQLFTAGHGTTSRALANAVYVLATHSSLQASLRRSPEAIPDTAEEVLRLRPPLHQLGRTLTKDVVIDGVPLREGENVVLNFASANHDPVEFDQPEQLLAHRRPNRHLTFGLGIHTCLGAPLARLELRVVLEELLERTDAFSMCGEPVPEEVRGGHFTSGFTHLPISLAVRSGGRPGAAKSELCVEQLAHEGGT